MGQGSKRAVVAAGALLSLVLAAPLHADVKDGVDAWGRGDYAGAVREWVGPAAKGDPDAQFNLAQAYRLGRGVDADQVQAEALYARAAAQGHVKAADNYGLLLFQKGEREKAIPYVKNAAVRGDPRAQYLVGIAHFNGDLVQKDWRRAYALLTLANGAGLPQARGALAQMDQHIPIADRQAAQVLAASLKSEAEAARARDLAAVDLALGAQDVEPYAAPAPPAPLPPRAGPSGTAAGADFAMGRQAEPAAVPRVEERPRLPDRPASSAGPWKIQLGAFGVAGNADRLWNQLAGRSELAGKAKLKEPAGRLTKLLAGGYASKAAADAACASLKRSGQDCLVTR
ncbi:SPOR domain-containing protein [Qipengyuania zhejiangensis]|uniref:SPOR domain-containing protein n=1 Tax=Qipengyuania zhejiangensis TaxID=3077782 RepID=UPI002D77BE6E|nr:SPOR domain-containing protein [Qipengyuania sp. Z2]